MLKCREFVDTVDALVEGELTVRQRLSMRLHWFICKHCRRYLSQLRALLGAIPFMHKPASDEEVKRVMRGLRSSDGHRGGGE
ncbi:hypothetical protein [Spongiibacter tropicus]|uniref:anti-sigma factor family protein n=1 Tax=Spongiibacter tropicus TaxID=454602 RepID=UPI0003B79693|nr:hypothetical protein [Spongiibacter tropicus]